VLPFLCDERLAARLDLKAARQAGALRVQAAHGEPGAPPDMPERLAAELRLMASWLALDRVEVVGVGDLAPALRSALAS
jgi:uncharacterized protein YcaQ